MNVLIEKLSQIISEDVDRELIRMYESVLPSELDPNVLAELEQVRGMYPKMKKVPTSAIQRFQMLLKGIKDWTPERVAETTERPDDIKKLYKGIYYCALSKVNSTLTCDPAETSKDDLNISVPKLKNFLHSIYLNVGRELYNNPRAFMIKPLKFQKKVNGIVAETLTKYMPVVDIIVLENLKKAAAEAEESLSEKMPEESLLADPTPKDNSSSSSGSALRTTGGSAGAGQSSSSSVSKHKFKMSIDPSISAEPKFYNEIVMHKKKKV